MEKVARHSRTARLVDGDWWLVAPRRSNMKDGAAAGGLYGGGVSELNEHLDRLQDIATRARAFQANEASDPKAFSKTVVEDLGALAEAVIRLIKRAEI